MKQFNKPVNFDGELFLTKLTAANIAFNGLPHDLNGGDLWMDVAQKDVVAVKAILDAWE
jgi:hypothetical protein